MATNKDSKYKQGYYTPKHPEKYRGDVNKIKFRSSWELDACIFLDNNTEVLEWASEEIAIPYIKPTTGRVHKYYPDLWIKYRNSKGDIVEEIIEIKPHEEFRVAKVLLETDFKQMPPIRARNPKTKLYKQLTMLINAAKWKAALDFCAKRGIKFRVSTERNMFK